MNVFTRYILIPVVCAIFSAWLAAGVIVSGLLGVVIVTEAKIVEF